MSIHPLIDRAGEAAVRQSRGFREAAAAMTGAELFADYEREKDAAPRRGDAGKRYLPGRNKAPTRAKEEELVMAALRRRHSGDGAIERPDREGERFDFVEYLVPLQTKAAERGNADDPNQGVGKVAFLGLTGESRLAVVDFKYVEADARRTKTGDTPLRALLQTLAHAAIVDANREAIALEVAERSGRDVDVELAPEVIVLGTPRYWELCRKREAQKGAAWIQQMERLANEFVEAAGIPVSYMALRLRGDPILTTGEDGWPQLTDNARLLEAWDEFAGRVRPKPKPRPKAKATPEEIVVEADPDRPVRAYAMSEIYYPGDRIEHTKLGLGVVQGAAGPTKMRVRFGDDLRVLVHSRGGSAS